MLNFSNIKRYLLTKNKIKSDIIENTTLLENSAKFNFATNNFSANIQTIIYEDLDKIESDRFEYILPKIDISKKINNNTSLNGDFTFKFRQLQKTIILMFLKQ